MEKYEAILSRAAEKEMDRLPISVLWRIAAKIDMLEQDPRPAGSIKRSGSRNRWRLRIGEYRIIYAVDDSGQRLDITTVCHRREVYL